MKKKLLPENEYVSKYSNVPWDDAELIDSILSNADPKTKLYKLTSAVQLAYFRFEERLVEVGYERG